MAIKPSKKEETRTVTYTATRWALLKDLRCKALKVMTALDVSHFFSFIHGSLSRGDVRNGSDVDVFLPEVQNSFLVESALEKAKLFTNTRYIVQATPNSAMKAHIQIEDQIIVTFPLMQMRRVEREFYRFSGEISLDQLKADDRVAGVDKRLMLIEPTNQGHLESSIIGKEEFAAKVLSVSAQTVLDRVHALLKRDTFGRTGVFVKKELVPDETFELALKKLSDVNPAVRRRLKG